MRSSRAEAAEAIRVIQAASGTEILPMSRRLDRARCAWLRRGRGSAGRREAAYEDATRPAPEAVVLRWNRTDAEGPSPRVDGSRRMMRCTSTGAFSNTYSWRGTVRRWDGRRRCAPGVGPSDGRGMSWGSLTLRPGFPLRGTSTFDPHRSTGSESVANPTHALVMADSPDGTAHNRASATQIRPDRAEI